MMSSQREWAFESFFGASLLFISFSLLNDNDSDHWFSQLSLCPQCQSAWILALSLFGEKLAR